MVSRAIRVASTIGYPSHDQHARGQSWKRCLQIPVEMDEKPIDPPPCFLQSSRDVR